MFYSSVSLISALLFIVSSVNLGFSLFLSFWFLQMKAVFSGALEASHKLWRMLFSFLLGSKPFLIFLLTSSLIHKLFRTVLFSLPDVRGVLHRSFVIDFLFIVVRGCTLSDGNF